MSMVFDTPEQISRFRLIALKQALKLDVKHGIKQRKGISLIRVAQDYGFEGRTKKEALKFVDSLLSDMQD